jgi:hypothetical protein
MHICKSSIEVNSKLDSKSRAALYVWHACADLPFQADDVKALVLYLPCCLVLVSLPSGRLKITQKALHMFHLSEA